MANIQIFHTIPFYIYVVHLILPSLYCLSYRILFKLIENAHFKCYN